MNSIISLFIVDDHPTLRDGLKLCLSDYPDIRIAGEAGNGEAAIEQLIKIAVDVVLMDVSMPGANGIDTTEILIEALPDIKVLMFSMHEDAEFVTNAIGIGAKGYVLKSSPTEEIYCAIQSVYSGGTHFSSDIAKNLISNRVKTKGKRLTSREQHILAHIANGQCNKSIAQKLNISVRTVEAHRRNIKSKLECKSVAEMVKYALESGLRID